MGHRPDSGLCSSLHLRTSSVFLNQKEGLSSTAIFFVLDFVELFLLNVFLAIQPPLRKFLLTSMHLGGL